MSICCRHRLIVLSWPHLNENRYLHHCRSRRVPLILCHRDWQWQRPSLTMALKAPVASKHAIRRLVAVRCSLFRVGRQRRHRTLVLTHLPFGAVRPTSAQAKRTDLRVHPAFHGKEDTTISAALRAPMLLPNIITIRTRKPAQIRRAVLPASWLYCGGTARPCLLMTKKKSSKRVEQCEPSRKREQLSSHMD